MNFRKRFEKAFRNPKVPIEVAYAALLSGVLAEFDSVNKRATLAAEYKNIKERRKHFSETMGDELGVSLSDNEWFERKVEAENILNAAVKALEKRERASSDDFDGIFIKGAVR